MNKKEFLKILSRELRGIPEEERSDIIIEYEEHFEAGINRGRSEKDMANSIGNPVMIARELKAATLINIAEKDSSIINILLSCNFWSCNSYWFSNTYWFCTCNRFG